MADGNARAASSAGRCADAQLTSKDTGKDAYAEQRRGKYQAPAERSGESGRQGQKCADGNTRPAPDRGMPPARNWDFRLGCRLRASVNREVSNSGCRKSHSQEPAD
jgi:hypothetical protein